MILHLLMLFWGIVMLVYPELFFYLGSWKYKDDASPSKWYIFSTRFGGVVFIIVSIVSIITI